MCTGPILALFTDEVGWIHHSLINNFKKPNPCITVSNGVCVCGCVFACWNFTFELDIASGIRQVNSIKSDCSAMLDQNMQGRKLKIRFLVMVCKTSCCASSLPISDVNSLRNITPAAPHESSLSPPS